VNVLPCNGVDSLQLERRYVRGALVALNKEELPLYQHILTVKPCHACCTAAGPDPLFPPLQAQE